MKLRLYIPLVLLAVVVLGLAASGAFADNIDPNSDGSKYAYGENGGWINAKPAGCSGCGLQVNAADVTGYMWGENIGWVNMSCKNNYTFSCAGSPGGKWGVTRSYAGALSGYAWSENTGWINMSCTNNYGPACTGSPGGTWGVSISLSTGVFSGRAWSENGGWITFSSASPPTYQVQTSSDFDGDGVLNNVDNCPFWSNPSQALPLWPVPAGDSDCDGFPDSVPIGAPNALNSETNMGTDPSRHCAATPARNDEPPPAAWPVDFDDNQLVNGSDLLTFAPVFGSISPAPPFNPRWDLNGDGRINGSDLLKVAPFFGKRCAQLLTVNKICSPTTDTGKFNLQIDGVTPATGANVACGGTTGPVVVSLGAHTVSETAGAGTNLADYTTVIGGNCAGSGAITLASGDVKTCTITNTHN